MQSQSARTQLQITQSVRMRRWYIAITMLLYMCGIFFVALATYRELVLGDHTFVVLAILVVLLVILCLVHAILTLRRNLRFVQAYAQQEHETHLLGVLLNQLADILECEHLRVQATRTLISTLGYDVATLFLLEQAAGTSQPLLVNVASSTTEAESWRFWGANELTAICLSGQETTLNWSKRHIGEIAEFDFWWQRQQGSIISFFPLIYHGRKIGALGVARHTQEGLNASDISLLRLYAEQLAALLEHAHLYEESREREAFSHAIANIATRLNAATIEPVELSQLICEEGGHALKADYTILYLPDEQDENLQPLTHWSRDMDQRESYIHWPAISLDEPDGQAFYDLQPRLLTLNGTKPLSSSETTHMIGSLIEGDNTWNVRHGPTLRETLWQCGGRSAILTPMMSEGDPIALLIFVREQTARHDWRAFSVFDLPHAQDFGEQAAVAFTNARLYEQLRTAHRRLQELDQMKDQFMGTASHELRTPLTAVQGYIELLSQYDDILPSDERRDFLEKARRGCDELAMLLSNVMDASRLERDVAVRAALLKPVSLKETIENVVLMIEPNLTKERRTLQVEVAEDLSVRADPMRLRQVLMNICANALKYSKPQTPLAIIASAQQEPASMVTIRVKDQGKGIAPEDQERIFQRFFRLEVDVNSPVRGSGLGLYISKRLIEAMGGKIWIESRGIEGEGSTFAIQLPMAG
ncbi:GAF domain-containing sensor histidine kinase [Ktedonospora formicarum]|uniref:histidine kinase n=1 Tax=Ktedonospora formicarum TaxID=2778364 RepID=A0A8J3MSN1_9CHLR|nr:GAF domain-containing sensor histidine kinase [Ktedonospora formicarum]GHO44788.1 hypothetical protein KSX_29510 [Ktedonospora formicarum]